MNFIMVDIHYIKLAEPIGQETLDQNKGHACYQNKHSTNHSTLTV